MLNRRWGVPLADSAASLLRLRVQDLVVVGALAATLFVPWGAVWLRAVLAVVAVALLAVVTRWIARRLRAGIAHVPNFVGKIVAGVDSMPPRTWLWAITNWIVKGATVALLFGALAGADSLASWGGAIGGEIAAVMPVQPPAGFGAYEAGVWAGAKLAGEPVDGQTALGAALTVHAFSLVLVVVASAISEALARRREGATA
jgi:hypothetical protein